MDKEIIKVLHVAPTSTGGAGFVPLILASNFDKTKFDVAVAVGSGPEHLLELFKDNITAYHLSCSRTLAPFAILKGLFQVYRLAKRKKFDIIHSHTAVGGFIGRIAGKLAGVPLTIWTIHGFASHRGPTKFNKYLFLLVERFLDKFTDHYVAVSKALKQEGVERNIFKADKTTVIYNGIDPESYNKEFDMDLKKKELGIGPSQIVIGTVGRLEPQKAIHDFIRAVSYIAKKFPHIKVLIAGDGPLRGSLENLITELNLQENILILGWRHDIPELLSLLDIFCLSSLWEGCPIVLLEAMASGKPVVATNVGGVKEIVEDKKSGILITHSNPEILGDAILDLINDKEKAKEMGLNGRKTAENIFTLQHMLKNHENLYLDLMGKKH